MSSARRRGTAARVRSPPTVTGDLQFISSSFSHAGSLENGQIPARVLHSRRPSFGFLHQLTRRGYVFATADPTRISHFRRVAEEAAEGFEDQPSGSDLILDPALIRWHFPYLSETVVGLVHARRCGWLSAQQLGMYLLEQAREHGVTVMRGRVEAIDQMRSLFCVG